MSDAIARHVRGGPRDAGNAALPGGATRGARRCAAAGRVQPRRAGDRRGDHRDRRVDRPASRFPSRRAGRHQRRPPGREDAAERHRAIPRRARQLPRRRQHRRPAHEVHRRIRQRLPDPHALFNYGPYVRKIPPVPLGPARGSTKIATAPAADVGWIYDETTGSISRKRVTPSSIARQRPAATFPDSSQRQALLDRDRCFDGCHRSAYSQTCASPGRSSHRSRSTATCGTHHSACHGPPT